jgi:hypothetical protein
MLPLLLIPAFVIAGLIVAAVLYVFCTPASELRRVSPISAHRGFTPS